MSQITNLIRPGAIPPPSGYVQTLTGNVGPAIPPDGAGNIDILTANSTPVFTGSGNQLQVDFDLTNLLLGSSGSAITTGAQNVGYGSDSLDANISGNASSAYGFQSMAQATASDNCVSIGNSSLYELLTGDNNVALGVGSLGNITTGSNNLAAGYLSGSGLTLADSNNILIGNVGAPGQSARISIGTPATHTTFFAAGIDGVNVGSVATVVTENANQLGTAVLTAGTGISITPAANLITIAATGAGSFTWSVITANQTAVVNNGYFCNKAGTLALLLPAASAVGDTIEVSNENTALGTQLTQAAGQQILIGNTNTTLGATGTLTSTAVGDTLTLVCYIANTTWRVVSMVGNWTVV